MIASLSNQISNLNAEINNLRNELKTFWEEDGSDTLKSFKDFVKKNAQHTQNYSAMNNSIYSPGHHDSSELEIIIF